MDTELRVFQVGLVEKIGVHAELVASADWQEAVSRFVRVVNPSRTVEVAIREARAAGAWRLLEVTPAP
jgi:hypothetical protein